MILVRGLALGLLVVALAGCPVCPSCGMLQVNLDDPNPCPGQLVRYKIERGGWGFRAYFRVMFRDQTDPPDFVETPIEGQFRIPDQLPDGHTSMLMEVVVVEGPYTMRTTRQIPLCNP